MAGDANVDIGKLSPDKLLSRFRKSGIVVCIVAAFALHVVVLGGTSVDYIHGLVDPVWKLEQEQRAEEARRQAEAERIARAGITTRRRAATQPTSGPATRPAATGPAAPGQRKPPKEITEMPKAGELPKSPGAGVSIDETEGR